ncbi:MAG: hypothetical protein ACK5GV_11380 [Bacteroidota bacterium]|jgi:hypothetical protein
MATPKTLPQKLPVFQNDSFSTWMQKTTATARELGDLNNLSSDILTDLVNSTVLVGVVSTVLYNTTKTNVAVTQGQNTIVLDTTANLHPEMPVSDGGVRILPGTKITSIVNETTVQISQNIISTGTTTIAFSGVPNMLVGSGGTTFTTTFVPSDTIRIKISSSPDVFIERRVLSIIDNTRLLVDEDFKTPTDNITINNAIYENLRNLNLVSALKYVHEQEIRRCLIRSIAMS